MDERSSKFPIESNLADLEQDLFGVLFEFHKKDDRLNAKFGTGR